MALATYGLPPQVITRDRFFPCDPTTPHQWTPTGKRGGGPPQIPAEMT